MTVTGILRAWVAVVVMSALAGLVSQVAWAVEQKPAALPVAIERVLPWLPETTETIVVAQSFVFPGPDRGSAAAPTTEEPVFSFHAAIPLMVLGELNELEMEKYLKPLAGSRVALALRGSRNYELVTASLPVFRAEHCAIVVFENDLAKAGEECVKTLRAGAAEVRKMAGRSVFVFPPRQGMHAARKPKWPGQLGIYLVMLNSNTILCATSDTYLEQLLERIDTPGAKRALPADLREWNHVDPAAAAWMLRHNSTQGETPPVIEGVTWTFAKDQFQAVYLTAVGAEEKAARLVHGIWEPALRDLRPTIEPRKNGSVVVTSTVENLNFAAAFGLGLQIHWLEVQPDDFEFKPPK